MLLKSCSFAYSEVQPPYQELHRGREAGNFFTHTWDIQIQAESWRPPSEHGRIPSEHTGLSFLGKKKTKQNINIDKTAGEGKAVVRRSAGLLPATPAGRAPAPPAFPQGPSRVTARGGGRAPSGAGAETPPTRPARPAEQGADGGTSRPERAGRSPGEM